MIAETACVDQSPPSERGRGGVIITSMAIQENGSVGGVALVCFKITSVLAGLEVGLCFARLTGSVITCHQLEVIPT
jgi:hypothetical protein